MRKSGIHKKLFKISGLLLLLMTLLTSAYYGQSIYRARAYTQEVIIPDLKAGQWRPFGGHPIRFSLSQQDLSPRQREILLKVQDPGFYDHRGIDLSTPGAGLTTLTQAIVKKLYFASFTPGFAKIKQSLIARFVVNDLIAKPDQITLFINLAYFGRVKNQAAVGLAAASRAYYAKSVKDLSEDAYISLIAMLVMPGTFHLREHPQWNQERARRIKALIDGRYRPRGLMDQYYGSLPEEVIRAGLPAFSYFGDRYKDTP